VLPLNKELGSVNGWVECRLARMEREHRLWVFVVILGSGSGSGGRLELNWVWKCVEIGWISVWKWFGV
jgi:hypothetical protein